MIKEGKIGVHDTVCLLTIATCNKIFFTGPSFLLRIIGNTGWYMTLISCGLTVVLFTIVCLLLKRFPGKNIVEIYDAALGRVFGFIFSFALMTSFLAYTGVLLREFADVLKVFVFPFTPSGVLIAAIVSVAAVAAFLGFETITRTAKLAAYFALFGFLMVLAFSSQYFHFAYLFPILGYGLDKTVETGVMRITAYTEVFILIVFAGSIQGIRHIRKAGYISILLTGAILSLGLLCFIMVFSYSSITENASPMFTMARIIKYGSFLQRLDPFFLFLWIITTILATSILLYTTVSVYCKMFKLQDNRPVIIPLSVLVFSIAMFPKDFSSVASEYVQQIRTYGDIMIVILPIITLIVAALRKKKGEKQNA